MIPQINIMTEDQLHQVVTNLKDAFIQEVKTIKLEQDEKVLLGPNQLAKFFKYRGSNYFRDKIRKGEFGRVDIDDKCSASIEETRKYLFDHKKRN